MHCHSKWNISGMNWKVIHYVDAAEMLVIVFLSKRGAHEVESKVSVNRQEKVQMNNTFVFFLCETEKENNSNISTYIWNADIDDDALLLI